ncbi:MAG: AMP-binding protein, partial [Amphiplicatus sp.]
MANEIILDPTKFEAAKEKLKAENPLFAVGEAEIRGVRYKAFTGAPPNLVGVFFYGVQHGEKDFLLYEDERLSFVETWSRACRLAKALAEDLGDKKGDHVAIAKRSQPEWCIAFMAVVSLGAVVTPLNAWWKT